MSPVLGIVAGYPVYIFAVTLNLGVAAGLALAVWLASRRGVAPASLLDAAIWTLPAGLIGARLLYVAAHWPEYAPNPVTVLSIWEGGLSLAGAITLGLAAAWVALRIQGVAVGTCLDAAAPGLALGQAIGRLGCLATGCAAGVPVAPDSGWPSLRLPDSTGLVAARFPSQVVESAGDLVLCAVLLALWSRRPQPGTVVAAHLLGYGLLRAAAEPLRVGATFVGPLPLALWWSAAAVAAGAAWLVVGWQISRLRRAAGQPTCAGAG